MTKIRGENFRLDGPATGLIVVAGALMTLGVVMLCSTGATLDRSVFDSASWRTPPLRQAAFAVGGVLVMLAGARIGPRFLAWRSGSLLQPAVLLLLVAVGLLVAVWSVQFGHASHGKNRWVTLGGLTFQPSEVAKFALMAFLAAFLTRASKRRPGEKPDLCIAIVAIAAVCCLIGVEDFGTGVLVGAVAACMIVVRGCTLGTVAAWAVPVVVALYYMVVSQSYRVARMFSFIDIWDDPHETDYHVVQSLAAIASGGWTGRGLGAGLAKYDYLPEAQTDFIFAIICEETGLIGGAMVILLYVVLVLLGLRVMRRAVSNDGGFSKLFAFGVTITIGFQAVMNVAVVTVVAPTKGIALPLVSAGGSGVLCFCAAIGLLAGTSRPLVASSSADEGELLTCVRPGLLSGVGS